MKIVRAICITAFVFGMPVHAADKADPHIERAKEYKIQAEAAQKEVRKLNRQLRNLGAQRARLEKKGGKYKTAYDRILAQEQAVLDNLESRRTSQALLLSALMRMGENPMPALAFHPDQSLKAATGASLMQHMTPHLERQAQRLAKDLTHLRSLQKKRKSATKDVNATSEDIENLRRQLLGLIEEKKRLEALYINKAKQEVKTAQGLVKGTENLNDLISGLKDYRLSRSSNIRSLKGQLPLPVTPLSMRLVRGDIPALQVSVLSNSQLIAPLSGEIEHAGELRGYGGVIIINMGDGARLVISGLGRVFQDAGAKLKSGDILGEALDGQAGKADITIRLWHKGRAVNPAPWFSLSQDL